MGAIKTAFNIDPMSENTEHSNPIDTIGDNPMPSKRPIIKERKHGDEDEEVEEEEVDDGDADVAFKYSVDIRDR